MMIWVRNSEVAAKRIRERYLQAILRQDITYFDSVGAGEVAIRIQNDTYLVHLGISEKVPMAAMNLSTFATGYIIAFVRSWKLALACCSILPFIVLAGAFMNFFLSKMKLAQLDHGAKAGTLAEEVISTIRTAQAFGTQKILGRLYGVHLQKSHDLDGKMSLVQGIGMALFFFVIYAAYALAFSFGATLVLRGQANVGIVVNVFSCIMMGSFSVVMLSPGIRAISNARAAAAKLFDTIDRVPPIDSASPAGLTPDASSIQGHISLRDVCFNYPSRADVPVLQGINLEFPAGKTSALVGASGSGKSTIIALIERFYDPLSGSVYFDGIDIKDLNIRWLRSHIGLVSQEPTLFSTTIRGNVEHGLIGTGMENLSNDERLAKVQEACIKANAHDFITALPEGYNTLIGERGFLLSGGQKQRIAIARAIVSDPAILLLDEATSALDTQSEGVVQNALDNVGKGRTTITIAHRLSTIKDAETIFVMDDGRVLEQGNHAQLLCNSEGPYARLVRTQKLKGVDRGFEEPIFSSGTHTLIGAADKVVSAKDQKDEVEKTAMDEKPLARSDTHRSLASELLRQRQLETTAEKEKEYGIFYIMGRMARINRSRWKLYLFGFSATLFTGMSYPTFGIVFGMYQSYSYPTSNDR
jgi:ATP-binding cassette subfamily B (MDR/TAP) protein 1